MDPIFKTYLQEGQMAGSQYRISIPPRLARGNSGDHLGHRAGSSLEFLDHRNYQMGDDLRRIDWHAYARTDKLTMKLFREEVSPHVDIILDGSQSMQLAESEKVRGALGVASILTQAASRSGYSHNGWLVKDGITPIVNGKESGALWDNLSFNGNVPLVDQVSRSAVLFKPRGIRVIISDLLWMGNPLSLLTRLSDQASMVVVVQILAKTDVDPQIRGNLRLVDSETNKINEMFVDAQMLDRYQRRFQAHQENWHRATRQVGAIMTTLIAEDIVDAWHLDALIAARVLEVA